MTRYARSLRQLEHLFRLEPLVGAGAGGVAPMAQGARSYQEAAECGATGAEQLAAAVEEAFAAEAE